MSDYKVTEDGYSVYLVATGRIVASCNFREDAENVAHALNTAEVLPNERKGNG